MSADIHFLPSRTGYCFGTSVQTESDGSLVLIGNDGHGIRSAHRDFAAKHFGHKALWCMNRLTWINTNGVRVQMTRWQTQEFRKS